MQPPGGEAEQIARTVAASGLAVLAAGLGLLSLVDAATPYPLYAAFLLVLSVGMGLCVPLLSVGIMSALPPDRAGLGSGLNSAAREIGSALGAAVMGTVLTGRFAGRGGGTAAGALAGGDAAARARAVETFVDAMAAGFAVVAVVVAVVGLSAAAGFRDRK
ncbi:hypothetical protein [Actinomadura keratinilytica]|uniref:Major facilitator superfamily (MFS) profile domain-containing protein n=1 Tax=Actinomadura keratinilytica TaxID=547461 RepID=A0ABP6UIG0_9ACTN